MNKQTRQVLHSSDNNEWGTPWDFFKKLDDEFHFNLDVCASKENTKVPDNYIDMEMNALEVPWYDWYDGDEVIAFMNPPFSVEYIGDDGKPHRRRVLPVWVEYALLESVYPNCTVVALIPARTGTRWWYNYVTRASEIRYVTGRLKFIGAPASAPFDSAVVIFGNGKSRERTRHRYMDRDSGLISEAFYMTYPSLI